MTTGSVTDKNSGGATLQGSFSGVEGTILASGFEWSESSSAVSSGNGADIQLGSQTGTNGNLSFELTGLLASTTYYYRPYLQVIGSGDTSASTFYGSVQSFTTSASAGQTLGEWLELPALTGHENYVGVFYSGGNGDANRNYSYAYSYKYYASLWTAYHLTLAHKTGNASTSNWSYNPNIAQKYQVNMTGNSYPMMYGANYSKGHQCPNANRVATSNMNSQTYYVTNQTPQIQNGFNGGIWSALENAERSLVTTDSDVLYVVTGPVYQTVGGNEEITYINASAQNAYPETVPVPNYYWKAFLKVTYSGNTITAAKAIGFWFEHKVYNNNSFTNCAVSINYIEEKTGLDLFHYLPDGIESSAETNTSWSNFTSTSNINSVTDNNWGSF